MTEQSKAPPIGLMPKFAWVNLIGIERCKAILDAVERYSAAGKPVPQEWIDELRELML